jgi:hypothetical protein
MYYDLLLRCAPEKSFGIDINPLFYHAFDMDALSLNYARQRSTKRNIAETPSSILKRRRTSSSSSRRQPPPPPATTKRRVRFSPNDSASKHFSFDYASTPSKTMVP